MKGRGGQNGGTDWWERIKCRLGKLHTSRTALGIGRGRERDNRGWVRGRDKWERGNNDQGEGQSGGRTFDWWREWHWSRVWVSQRTRRGFVNRG